MTAAGGPGDRPYGCCWWTITRSCGRAWRRCSSEQHDVEVVGEAANGREAVDMAHRLQPDVMMMDVAMPLMNGDEATRQIKTHLPGTRVIALSMYDEPDMMEKMLRAGAEGYILKTAPSEELLAAIRGEVPDS